MSKVKLLFLLGSLVLIFVQCSKEERTDNHTNITKVESELDYNSEFDFILKQEYDNVNNTIPPNIRDQKFCDAELYIENTGNVVEVRTNRRHENLVGTDVSIIDINVLDNCPEEWDLAIRVAIHYMNLLDNSLDGRFYYRYRRLNNNVALNGDINVSRVNWGAEDAYARASFPDRFGNPGNRIRLNEDRFTDLSLGLRILVFVHELGHCIGFHHTDTNNGLENVGSCDANDIESIMRAEISHYSLYSACDKSAYEEMYSD